VQVNAIIQILNAHLNSLQWLGQNLSTVKHKLSDAEKQVQSLRMDHSRARPSFY
jgi:hypothetical protein